MPRLSQHDYSSIAVYFITQTTQNRKQLFGNCHEDEMVCNDAGKMIQYWWQEISNKFPTVILDSFIVMPDHWHGILAFTDSIPDSLHDDAPGKENKCLTPSLSRVMQWFKTMTTNDYIRHVKTDKWEPFPNRLWLASYYEHIIRNEVALQRIREYIMQNPIKWSLKASEITANT